MRFSQKRKRSPLPSLVTPHTSGSKHRYGARSSSRASTVHAASGDQSEAQFCTPFQTEFEAQVAQPGVLAEDDFEHVIAAIDMDSCETVGCAYYSAEEEKMYFLGDSHSGAGEIIEACESVCHERHLTSHGLHRAYY